MVAIALPPPLFNVCQSSSGLASSTAFLSSSKISPTGVGVARATGSYKLGVVLFGEAVVPRVLLLELFTLFALVSGVDAAAHIPISMSANIVTPKIHFGKLGFRVMSVLL